jgi:beta-lactam-binding protein with PASTA domain
MHASTVILVAFLTSVLTSTGTVYLVERLNLFEKPATVEQNAVPNVRGLPEAEARSNLEAAGFIALMGQRELSPDAKPGTVLRQSVPGGQPLPKGHQVTLTIADAPPKVPNVAGLGTAEARILVEKEGFKLEIGEPLVDATVPAGKIVKQGPAADTPYEKGKSVLVQVSSGPGDVEMPKLIGLGLNKAKEQLEKLGLKPQVRWVSQAETATFAVLGQKPPAAEKVKAGAEVELVVNR